MRAGLAAQTLSSAGGSRLAVLALIASGIALASQLRRAVIVRVVGAPLVRRRPRRRSRALSEEYQPPARFADRPPSAGDEGTTEWMEIIPLSLAVAEVDTQAFTLARALPSMVAAQQSRFRTLPSASGAVARAVGSAAFSPGEPRAPPSETSVEPVRRGSPDSFPEGQGTFFAGEAAALAVGAAFRASASSLVFDLSIAARETTEMAMGSQAVGARFVPQAPRAASEGTGFRSLPPASASPSLLDSSVTGIVDTSFKTRLPTGANLGLVPPSSAPSSATPPASGAPTPDLPIARETASPSGMSAEASGPPAGGLSGAAGAGASSPSSSPDLNAGPYAVPNGFNSALSTSAFAVGARLSMGVRSLASSGPSTQLPLRASQHPAASEGGSMRMPVVPEQYPSSYPVGVAFSISAMVASLGLGPPAPSSVPAVEGQAGRVGLGADSGKEEETGTGGTALVGGTIETLEPGLAGASPLQAETSPPSQLDTGAYSSPTRAGLDDGAQPSPFHAEFAPLQPLFGDRWATAVASAAGIGRAMLGLLSLAETSPAYGGSWSRDAETRTYGVPSQVGAVRGYGPAGSDLETDRASTPETNLGREPLPSPGRTRPLDALVSASDYLRSTRWQKVRLESAVSAAQSSPPSAYPRSESDLDLAPGGIDAGQSPLGGYRPSRAEDWARGTLSASYLRASPSVWKAVTLLPGILAPVVASVGRGRGRRSSRRFQALRLATSLRSSLLAEFASAAGAQVWDFVAGPHTALGGALGVAHLMTGTEVVSEAAAGLVAAGSLTAPQRFAGPSPPLPASLAAGVGSIETGSDESGEPSTHTPSPRGSLEGVVSPGERASGTFVRERTPALAKRVDLFDLGGVGEAGPVAGGPQPALSRTAYLPLLLAASASRAILAAGVSAWAARASALAAELAGSERAAPGAGLPLPAGRTTMVEPSPPVSLPPLERELEAASPFRPLGRGEDTEGVFFGLEAIAQALSLAASLPSAARSQGTGALLPPRTAAQPRATAAVGRAPGTASPEAQYAGEPSPRPQEAWRSVPEETIARMLGEASRRPTHPGEEAPQESDDRELRRKLEKIVDEELRRHGYQP